MPIPEATIDEIQQKVDIVEVISSRIPLKKVGRSYKALCPFHHEKTPSFIVSPDKQIYHCFGCGAGGNVFSFLMKHENLQFPEAVELLASKAGVLIPRAVLQREGESSLAVQLYNINELACQFFQERLKNNESARVYLNSRGVGDEITHTFRIGYAPDAWEGLLNFFKEKGYAPALLEKAGLVIANDKGGYYDRFRNRITFPIIDLRQRILGFGGRVLDSSLPKYINSPETGIYYKGRNLYGLNFSKEYIKKCGYALIVEGYLDFIIPYQAGVNNLIATLGTALTIEQVKLLKRFANTVIMVYDPDEAGEAASLRNLDLFISEDVNVYIAELPASLDPDSFIRKFGAEDFKKLLKASKNLFDYKLGKLESKFNITSANGKARIASEMLPTLSKINNAVLKSNLIKRLAQELSVDEESIRTELKKVKPDYGERQYFINSAESKKNAGGSAEKMLLALLLAGAGYIEKIKKELALEEFKDTSIREVVNAIFEIHKTGKETTPAKLINYLGNNGNAATLISEAANLLEVLVNRDKVLTDCILRVKRDNLKDRLNRLQDAIKSAYNQKDDDKVKELVREYDNLVRAPASGER